MLGSYLMRLGLVGVGALRRGKVALLDEVRTPMQVWPTDVDTYAHVNNGRYLTLMDFGRLELSVRTGLLQAALRGRWRPVVVACAARFRRELRALHRFELVTALRAWDEKYFYVEHRFEQDGQVCALGFVQGVTKRAGKTVPPVEMFAAVGHAAATPAAEGELAGWIASLPKRARG